MTENIFFPIGTSIQIDLPLSKKKFDSSIIGDKKNDYLILKMPELTSDEISLYLASGNDVILRFLYEGNIIGLRTKIIGKILNPFKLIFCYYPLEVKDLNLRKSPRIKCFLPGTLKKDEQEYDGMLIDLGKGGGLFSFKIELIKRRLFKVEDHCKLFFKMPGQIENIEINALIRSTKREEIGLSLGLQFLDVGTEILNKLNEYITIALSYS